VVIIIFFFVITSHFKPFLLFHITRKKEIFSCLFPRCFTEMSPQAGEKTIGAARFLIKIVHEDCFFVLSESIPILQIISVHFLALINQPELYPFSTIQRGPKFFFE